MINWNKTFKIISILSGILTVGFLISAIWTTGELSLNIGLTGMILFFVTTITTMIWLFIYFDDFGD